MSKPIHALMQKEMSRQEFLTMVGFGMLSAMGFGSLIRLLTGKSFTIHHNAANGYGSSSYGGK